MKRWIFWGCLLAIWLTTAQAWAQPYQIDQMDVQINWKSNGEMEVQEALRVTFNESRRGIFRVIPIHLASGKGTTRSIQISKIQVTDAGNQSLETKITYERANLRIRVGNPDVWLPAGTQQTYVFRYTVLGAVNWFDAQKDWTPSAELYWNATGQEWDAPVNSATVQVTFPKSPGGKGVRARVFAGPYGSRASQVQDSLGKKPADAETRTSVALREDRLLLSRGVPMEPGEGITFGLGVPKDLIAQPSTQQKIRMFILPNLGFSIPIFVFLGMFLVWLFKGRDPKGGPMVVQYEPPDGLGPAECGTLLDETVDQRDLAAGILSLAVKGCLTISPKETGLVFKRQGADLTLTRQPPKEPLTAFEETLLELLDFCGPDITEEDLSQFVAPKRDRLTAAAYGELVARHYYLARPDQARVGWFIFGIFVVVILAVAFTALSPTRQVLPSIVGGLIGLIIVGFFSMLMSRRTQEGARARMRVVGLEEFIRRAQRDELEYITRVDRPAALFEQMLPYAVAFGMTKQWAAAFEGIVQEMPRWYNVPPGTPFHPIYFANDLTSINSALGSAAATPPRSDGASGGSSGFSSGGGFSGGGFGGGGGGSW
ncbi:MAG TPA: DUF2207 domain-containing protein [Fimbriimonadaceae bacterium]|nr:DUF2207 domain-containing protein [Fimbriimonadaceae bacterium]HRJ32137.1 DUF2207 domain-containing protein [Fimbriimonadaceae bacterium]